jgi:hypothetical protein
MSCHGWDKRLPYTSREGEGGVCVTRWGSWFRRCATSRKVAVSISDGITGIFHWHNLSSRTMALGLTHPLTEMSTRSNFFLPFEVPSRCECVKFYNNYRLSQLISFGLINSTPNDCFRISRKTRGIHRIGRSFLKNAIWQPHAKNKQNLAQFTCNWSNINEKIHNTKTKLQDSGTATTRHTETTTTTKLCQI